MQKEKAKKRGTYLNSIDLSIFWNLHNKLTMLLHEKKKERSRLSRNLPKMVETSIKSFLFGSNGNEYPRKFKVHPSLQL